jgi:hypothetical protein
VCVRGSIDPTALCVKEVGTNLLDAPLDIVNEVAESLDRDQFHRLGVKPVALDSECGLEGGASVDGLEENEEITPTEDRIRIDEFSVKVVDVLANGPQIEASS